MKINFKKIAFFFLSVFGTGYIENDILCPLNKKECEKDVPHIVEEIRKDSAHFFVESPFYVSGSLGATMSFRVY